MADEKHDTGPLAEIEMMRTLAEQVEQPGFGPLRGAAVARAIRTGVYAAFDLDDREAAIRACDWMVQRAEDAEKAADEARKRRKAAGEPEQPTDGNGEGDVDEAAAAAQLEDAAAAASA
jgi:hypothetical protein